MLERGLQPHLKYANFEVSGKALDKVVPQHRTTTVLRLFLWDHPVQGKINRGRNTNHQDGRHSIRTKQCPHPPSPKDKEKVVPVLWKNLTSQLKGKMGATFLTGV